MTSPLSPEHRGRDLDSPEEIAELVRRFYQDVAQDGLLGPMFNDVAQVDWADHLPKLTAFWCRVLLGIPGFAGNAMVAHIEVHDQEAFRHEHFQQWLDLFHEHVDLGWSGPLAEAAKEFARRVAFAHSSRLTGTPYEYRPHGTDAVEEQPEPRGTGRRIPVAPATPST